MEYRRYKLNCVKSLVIVWGEGLTAMGVSYCKIIYFSKRLHTNFYFILKLFNSVSVCTVCQLQ
jgi:hypothetical protein